MLIRFYSPNPVMKHMSLFQHCQPGRQTSGSHSGVLKVTWLINYSWGLKFRLSGSLEYSPHQLVFQGQALKFPFCLDLPLLLPTDDPMKWRRRFLLSNLVQCSSHSLLSCLLPFSSALLLIVCIWGETAFPYSFSLHEFTWQKLPDPDPRGTGS